MSNPDDLVDRATDLTDALAAELDDSDRRVSVAESLTSGKIAVHLGAAGGSSGWFAGGVVAYNSDVKYDVLGVRRGPVVSAVAAEQMATGVARLLGTEIAVAVTGVGGPDEQEGQPVGTVYIGVHNEGTSTAEEHHFEGDAEDILAATTVRALELLLTCVRAREDSAA